MTPFVHIKSWAKMRWQSMRPQKSDSVRQVILSAAPKLVYAVGDVHGCHDLYRQMEDEIARDAARTGETALLILLGDFIDRGPQSAQMMDHLLAPAPQGVTRLALMGNHEDMFVQFLRRPRPDHPWLQYGGEETLRSYGIAPSDMTRALAHRLAAHIPAAHIEFLEQLPLALHMPGLMFSHAGANPYRGAHEQSKTDLLCANPALLDSAPLPLRVVHGHTPTADGKPVVTHARVNVDTGAYATGVLTAIELREAKDMLFKVVRAR